MSIDWADPNAHISPHFTVRESLWLPNWQVMHRPNALEQGAILRTAETMEAIRTLLGGKSISVHSWLRPPFADVPGPHKGQDYNAAIGGAPRSFHRTGMAVDFSIADMSCDEVRSALMLKLDALGICMEDLPGSNWVHIDRGAPRAGRRFFKP